MFNPVPFDPKNEVINEKGNVCFNVIENFLNEREGLHVIAENYLHEEYEHLIEIIGLPCFLYSEKVGVKAEDYWPDAITNGLICDKENDYVSKVIVLFSIKQEDDTIKFYAIKLRMDDYWNSIEWYITNWAWLGIRRVVIEQIQNKLCRVINHTDFSKITQKCKGDLDLSKIRYGVTEIEDDYIKIGKYYSLFADQFLGGSRCIWCGWVLWALGRILFYFFRKEKTK